MLSAGFATTTLLKSRLLPDAAADDTAWDARVASLGKSVAARFDRHCNRHFVRDAAAVDTFSAAASAWVLRRIPVESISAVAIVEPDGTSSAIAAGSWRLDQAAGLVEMDTPASAGRLQVLRVAYSGGYWLDPGDGTALPTGATALPDDVLEAYLLQCQHEAEGRGLFAAISLRAQDSGKAPTTSGIEFHPAVAAALRPYRRFAAN